MPSPFRGLYLYAMEKMRRTVMLSIHRTARCLASAAKKGDITAPYARSPTLLYPPYQPHPPY